MLNDLLPVLAYLVGSVSTAVVVARLFGLPDPRAHGSKNPGTTNILRLGGRSAAALTLAGDTLKGVVPVLLAKALSASPAVIAATALGAFIGHLFPVFFRFRGGKGVATALGVLAAMNPWLGLLLAMTWLLVAVVFRYSSLAAITSALLAPFYAWILRLPRIEWLAVAVLALLLLVRHHQNFRKLASGQESRIGH